MRNRTCPTSTTAPSRNSRLSKMPFTWERISTTRKPATRPENSSGSGTSCACSSTTPTSGGGGAAGAAGFDAGLVHQKAAPPTIATATAAVARRPIHVRAVTEPPTLSYRANPCRRQHTRRPAGLHLRFGRRNPAGWRPALQVLGVARQQRQALALALAHQGHLVAGAA